MEKLILLIKILITEQKVKFYTAICNMCKKIERFLSAHQTRRYIMERYIIFIPADGPCRLVACDDGDSIKLETLQELVDGPIEVTPSCLGASWARELVDGIDLIVNEEGRLRGLPYNGRASDLWEGGGICLLNGDALLAAAKGEDLIGFPKPVCRTICDEWELEMEDGTWND